MWIFRRIRISIYIIHAFIKKDDKTSPRDIEIGKQRLKELKEILNEIC